MSDDLDFNVPQPEMAASLVSGLPGWSHEVRPKAGETIRFVPLQRLDQCLAVFVHRQQVKYDGGFKYVPVGSKNPHLFTAVMSPFENDPNPKVSGFKLARYLMTFVLDGSETLTGHVAFVEVRDNYKKKDGTYNRLAHWEKESGESIKGHKVALSRQGTGVTDTVYSISVLGTHTFTDEQRVVITTEGTEVLNYLKGLFVREWSAEEFTRIYQQGIVNNQAPVQEHPTLPTGDELEIPF